MTGLSNGRRVGEEGGNRTHYRAEPERIYNPPRLSDFAASPWIVLLVRVCRAGA